MDRGGRVRVVIALGACFALAGCGSGRAVHPMSTGIGDVTRTADGMRAGDVAGATAVARANRGSVRPVPIGTGAAYELAAGAPPTTGPLACKAGGLPPQHTLMRAHVELFANGRVLLLPAGIGLRMAAALTSTESAAGTDGDSKARAAEADSGANTRAAVDPTHITCHASLFTTDDTGVVWLERQGLRVGDLGRVWGQPIDARDVAGFRAAPGEVSVFVDGRRYSGPPADVPLTQGAEIVVEVRTHVAAHTTYLFPQPRDW